MSQNPDFLPEDYTQRREQHRTAILFIGLFVAVMGGILGAFLFSHSMQRKANAEGEEINRKYEEAGSRLDARRDLDARMREMTAKAEISAMLLERVPRSRLLKEFSELMPKGVSLINLELRSHDVAPAPVVKSDTEDPNKPPEIQRPPEQIVTLNLTGIAPSDELVAKFMTALVHSPILSDVNLLFSEEFKNKDETVRRFRIEMHINKDADLISPREKNGN